MHHAVEGGCLCGAIRYRAEGPATHPTLCHCASCRRAAGAPLVAWLTFPKASFAFTRGEPSAYRSSPPVLRTFCGRCGTPLTYANDRFADEIDVTTCSLDQPESFAPRDQTWTRERLHWMHDIDALPSFPTTRERAD